MDIHSQILMEVQREFEALEIEFHTGRCNMQNHLQGIIDGLQHIGDNCRNLQGSLASIHEGYIMGTLGMNIIKKYMLGMILRLIVMIGIWIVVNFLDNNHFRILFDDSTPPYVAHILESRKDPSMHILLQFSYSPVLVDAFLVGSTYLDPHD
jgi:hypothetical protein